MYGFEVVAAAHAMSQRVVVDRQVEIDLLQARVEARLRALGVTLPDDVLSALAHDVLNDAVRLALDWLEPSSPVKTAESLATTNRVAR